MRQSWVNLGGLESLLDFRTRSSSQQPPNLHDSIIIAKNIGRTACTAYDATHGFSDQYILELDVFLKVIEELQLKSDPQHFSKYPNNELATVSINYLEVDLIYYRFQERINHHNHQCVGH